MKRVLGLVLVFAMLLAACSNGASSSTSSSAVAEPQESSSSAEAEAPADATPTGGDRTFAVVVHSTQSTYWQTLNSGAEAAAAESGDKIYFTAAINGGADINGQVDVMQNCINQNVDGILLAAADVDALVPITEKAIASGIPVVIVDCGLNTDQYASSIATDNHGAASELARQAAEDIGGEGQIAILNYAAGMLTGSLREDGFKETLAEEYPNIQILETQYYDNDTQKALEKTQNLLTANPDLKAIYATNEYGVVGACRALMEKQNKDIKVYGFDFSDDVLPLLEQDYCTGIMVQKPYDMGYLGVQTLIKVIDGETVEKSIDSGCVYASGENYQDEDVYKVLYPM